jgi:hypothetical protein
VGANWYLLLQQEQQHLPEELDRWNQTATYSCNRSITTSMRSWIGKTYSCNRSNNTSLRSWTGET